VRPLQDLAEAIDLVVICLVEQGIAKVDLFFHEQPWIVVGGDIADRKVYSFFDDQLIPADIRHVDLILTVIGRRALVFAADGVEENAIRFFRKRQEAQLRIIEEAVYKMELYKRFLAKELGAVKQYLVIFEIIDIGHLEGRHSDLPDHPAWGSSELNIMRRDQRLGQIGIILLLREHLMGKIQVILVDKASVKTFPLLVERTVAAVRQDAVTVGLFHDAFRY